MYRATATALALVSFLPRVGVGYQSVDVCCASPCGCEAPPVVCCDPCEPSAPAPTKAHSKLPTPADADAKKATPAESTPAELPKPALAPNADAITPAPLNTPAIEPMVTAPAEAPVSAAEPAPRYADPPAAAPAAVEPTRYDDVFSETPPATEPPAAESPDPATTEPETPAPETEPAEEPAAAEPADPASVDDPFTAPPEEAPTTDETTPSPAEESAPAPVEEPATETPEGDELFGPSSSHDVLTQPGGWASNASRPWNDAEGQLLVTGRITEVTAKFVVLSREDGQSQAVRYAHLGDEDLSFLRQQIEARRVQLASQAGDDELLAKQSR